VIVRHHCRAAFRRSRARADCSSTHRCRGTAATRAACDRPSAFQISPTLEPYARSPESTTATSPAGSSESDSRLLRGKPSPVRCSSDTVRLSGRFLILDSAWSTERAKFNAREERQPRRLNDGTAFEIYKRYCVEAISPGGLENTTSGSTSSTSDRPFTRCRVRSTEVPMVGMMA